MLDGISDVNPRWRKRTLEYAKYLDLLSGSACPRVLRWLVENHRRRLDQLAQSNAQELAAVLADFEDPSRWDRLSAAKRNEFCDRASKLARELALALRDVYDAPLPPVKDLFDPVLIAAACDTQEEYQQRQMLISDVEVASDGTIKPVSRVVTGRREPPWLGVLSEQDMSHVLFRLSQALDALRHRPLPDARPNTGPARTRALVRYVCKWFHEGYGEVPWTAVADLVNEMLVDDEEPIDAVRVKHIWTKK
jgi:hypothetical protein